MLANILQYGGLASVWCAAALDQITTGSDFSFFLIVTTAGLIAVLLGVIKIEDGRHKDAMKTQKDTFESQIRGLQDFYERALGIKNKDKKNDSKQKDETDSK